MPFRNRSEAGRRLAVALAGYKEQEPTILALPRGGVAIAAEVAAALDAPLDLILVRKVGVPFQPELAMGAVADTRRTDRSAPPFHATDRPALPWQ
jgi:putative phosphoribosyl transferase